MWEIPEPHSVLEVRVDDETDIIVRRHGNPAGPRVITSHGNGFAIDMYYPFWSLLADDFDLVVYGLRNHGWNRVSALQNHNFPTFVRDLDTIADAVEQHYGKKATVGVFHSVSSLATLLSPTMCARFAGLILFDPPAVQGQRQLRQIRSGGNAGCRDGATPHRSFHGPRTVCGTS